MNHIETTILNCYGIQEAEQNMVFAARLIATRPYDPHMEDLMDLYHQTYSKETVRCILPWTSSTNCTEIYGHHCCCGWSKQTFSDTDYKTSE